MTVSCGAGQRGGLFYLGDHGEGFLVDVFHVCRLVARGEACEVHLGEGVHHIVDYGAVDMAVGEALLDALAVEFGARYAVFVGEDTPHGLVDLGVERFGLVAAQVCVGFAEAFASEARGAAAAYRGRS